MSLRTRTAAMPDESVLHIAGMRKFPGFPCSTAVRRRNAVLHLWFPRGKDAPPPLVSNLAIRRNLEGMHLLDVLRRVVIQISDFLPVQSTGLMGVDPEIDSF